MGVKHSRDEVVGVVSNLNVITGDSGDVSEHRVTAVTARKSKFNPFSEINCGQL